jgi:hypothetical protein
MLDDQATPKSNWALEGLEVARRDRVPQAMALLEQVIQA